MKLTTFLRRFVNGQCPSRKLSTTLELTGIWSSMRRLWNASIRYIESGMVLEHAATLVCDAEGKVKLVHPVAGAPDEVVPNYDVAEGENFVGTFHTHPYENGLTGIAFSGEDIASAINEAEWISFVQSGDDVFALIRTDKTVSQIQPHMVVGQVNSLYNSLLFSSVFLLIKLFFLKEKFGYCIDVYPHQMRSGLPIYKCVRFTV
jgi:proteasome lid subunit RPN8/RPN11